MTHLRAYFILDRMCHQLSCYRYRACSPKHNAAHWSVCLTLCLLTAWLLPVSRTPLYAADCATNFDELQRLMGYYNLITLDDLSTTSDVEGRTFVGGSLTSNNSANFATSLEQSSPS